MVPNMFSSAEALRALNGEPVALWGAFEWDSTEDGQAFWSAEAHSAAVSPKAQALLRRWIAEDALFADIKAGDRVRALVDENPGEEFTKGKEYVVENSNGIYVNVIADDAGDPNGGHARFFELTDRTTEEAA